MYGILAASTLGTLLLEDVLPTVVLVAFVSLVGLALYGISLLIKRFGVSIDISNDSMVRAQVRAAVAGAEEWFSRQVKWYDKSKADAGKQKADWALARIRAQFPKLKDSEILDFIDEELGSTYGVGATGNRVVGLPEVGETTSEA